MEYVKKNTEAIQEFLKTEALTYDLMEMWNTKCQKEQSSDQVYENSEDFFEMFFPKSVDAVRAAKYGEYEFTHDFVKIDGYGNLQSFNDITDFVDIEELADHILENEELYNSWLELEEEDIADKVELLYDSHHGQYIPQLTVNEQLSNENWDWSEISEEDIAALKEGPDHEWYWEAWNNVLDNVTISHEGQKYNLMENEGLFAVPEDATEDQLENWII